VQIHLIRFSGEHNKYLLCLDFYENFNLFKIKSGLLGKLSCIVARNCMVIKAIETACDLIKDLPGCNSQVIEVHFFDSCQNIVENLDMSAFVITAPIIKQAIRLSHYSAMTKLVLSQYQVNPANTLEQTLETIFLVEEEAPEIGGQLLVENPHLVFLMKRILFFPDTSAPNVTQICAGNYLAGDVKEAFKKLNDFGLGKVVDVQSGNHRMLTHFQKISLEYLTEHKELASILKDFGTSAKDYAAHLAKIEYNETKRTIDDNSNLQPNKRQRTDNNESSRTVTQSQSATSLTTKPPVPPIQLAPKPAIMPINRSTSTTQQRYSMPTSSTQQSLNVIPQSTISNQVQTSFTQYNSLQQQPQRTQQFQQQQLSDQQLFHQQLNRPPQPAQTQHQMPQQYAQQINRPTQPVQQQQQQQQPFYQQQQQPTQQLNIPTQPAQVQQQLFFQKQQPTQQLNRPPQLAQVQQQQPSQQLNRPPQLAQVQQQQPTQQLNRPPQLAQVQQQQPTQQLNRPPQLAQQMHQLHTQQQHSSINQTIQMQLQSQVVNNHHQQPNIHISQQSGHSQQNIQIQQQINYQSNNNQSINIPDVNYQNNHEQLIYHQMQPAQNSNNLLANQNNTQSTQIDSDSLLQNESNIPANNFQIVSDQQQIIVDQQHTNNNPYADEASLDGLFQEEETTQTNPFNNLTNQPPPTSNQPNQAKVKKTRKNKNSDENNAFSSERNIPNSRQTGEAVRTKRTAAQNATESLHQQCKPRTYNKRKNNNDDDDENENPPVSDHNAEYLNEEEYH
jgi:hypothetical protein